MWGVTGAIFALPQSSENLWTELTGGKNAFMDLQMRAAEAYAEPASGAEVSLDQAERIALDASSGAKVVSVQLPLPGNELGLPTNYYQFQLADQHLDPRGFVAYGGGQNGVTVGLKGGPTLTTDDAVATRLWSGYRLGLHDGWMVNPWWRAIWLFFALSPVLFAATGITMWWQRRRNRSLRDDQLELALASAGASDGQVADPTPTTDEPATHAADLDMPENAPDPPD